MIVCNDCIHFGVCLGFLNCKRFEPARPRGKWLQREDKEYNGGGYNFCTACQYRFSYGAYPLIYEDNYCPHCGARMQKQGDEK